MTNSPKPPPARTQVRTASGRYQSVGKTSEGINVLKPATKPTHFTTGQIRSTIGKILTARTSAIGSK